MPYADLIYLADNDTILQQRLREAARSLGCRLHFGKTGLDALEEAACMDANVLLASSQILGREGQALRRTMRGLPLRHCGFILLLDAVPADGDGANGMANGMEGGADDVLLRGASEFEIMARLQAALRLAGMRRQWETARRELEQLRDREDSGGDYLHDATAQLVEIAAQLQSEVVHSTEREEASVRTAQTDIIAQAAAALRHEINNPLFAITGSAESVLRRLRAMQTSPVPNADVTTLIAGVERIQRGSERIQQVVQAISEMLTPATTDYVAGVAMLDLTTKMGLK
jgi:signal transduction histidine kinase